MSDVGFRDDYEDGSRSRHARQSVSRSPRRSFSPRSRSPSPRRERRRSRSPRRSSRGDRYSRSGYRDSGREGRGGGGSGQGRRVYVGNLAYDVKWGNLKDFMRSAGEVLHADVLMNAEGRSKGCGVVEYATASDAQRAISELSNQTLNGRMVYIREDREEDKAYGNSRGGGYGERSSRSYERPYSSTNLGASAGQITQPSLYITNLPYSVSWQDLKDLFRNAGQVVRADVQSGHDGRSRGTGTVVFESTADAQNAFKQFQGYDWQGRLLDIREDRFAGGRGGGRGGFSDRGGRGGYSGRGGYQGRDNGYSGGGGYSDSARGDDAGYDSYRAPPPVAVEPNPFTDDANGNGDPSATIFVRNLPWATSNDDLVELFSTIGKVERAEICLEPSGRSKGTGVVQFDGQDAAATSIQRFMSYNYGGRPLHLSFVRYESGIPSGPAAYNDRQESQAASRQEPYEGDQAMAIDQPL